MFIEDQIEEYGFSVKTFDIIRENESWILAFEMFRNRILQAKDLMDEKMLRNYYRDRLITSEQAAITIVQDQDKSMLAFSTILIRPEFGNSARVLNRLYFHPLIRNWGVSRPDNPDYKCNPRDVEVSPIMLRHQMRFLEHPQYKNIEWAFISKEPFKTRWCKMVADDFSHKTRFHWQVDEKLYPMFTNHEAYSCWQHMIYTNVSPDPSGFQLLNEGIEFDDFRQRFKS